MMVQRPRRALVSAFAEHIKCSDSEVASSKRNRRHRRCRRVVVYHDSRRITITCTGVMMMMMMVFFLLLLAAQHAVAALDNNNNTNNNQYVIIGVSGGLQKGFPDHSKLDYTTIVPPSHAHGDDDEEHQQEDVIVKAIFLGRALVRGYKAYLDVMEPTHRQYIHIHTTADTDTGKEDQQQQKQQPPPQQQPLINSNVIPTGCWHHANEYWMYLVDSRQVLSILMNEPRFLSITPDHGLVDLSADETSPVIRHIARLEIARQNKTDRDFVAFPIVTGVWYNPNSHVPSPVLYVKKDDDDDEIGGTEVTNFPQSLLKWIGMDPKVDTERTCQANVEAYIDTDISSPLEIEAFWQAVTQSIRQAEAHRRPSTINNSSNRTSDEAVDDAHHPWSSLAASCRKKAQFGTSPHQARINYAFGTLEFQQLLQTGGYDIDYVAAKVLFSSSSSSSS